MDKNINILRESIEKAVRNALKESKQQDKKIETIVENVVSKRLRTLCEDDENTNKKRNVLQWLRNDTVNTAAIRRELEGEPETQEDEDAKRSYFMKKVNQTDGKDFTNDEITRLYAIKSNSGN
jgi:phage-related minor tail protein